MSLNEIPKFFSAETRSLIDSALQQAWQKLKKDGPGDAALARRTLARTIRGSCVGWGDRPSEA